MVDGQPSVMVKITQGSAMWLAWTLIVSSRIVSVGDGGIGDSMIKPMCWEFYSTGGLGRLYYWSI